MTIRADLQAVAALVPERAKLLDVGCGDGELLDWLAKQKQVEGRGLELSQAGVNRAIARGLAVVQGDADADLHFYPDQAYDVVVLSQTLQTMRQPRQVLEQLVRIGTRAIVSVPNFGHWKNRAHLMFYGKMPVTKTLSYTWYDTPNIHFCTLSDFVELCEVMHIHIEKRVYVNHRGIPAPFQGKDFLANLWGEQGIFVLSRHRNP